MTVQSTLNNGQLSQVTAVNPLEYTFAAETSGSYTIIVQSDGTDYTFTVDVEVIFTPTLGPFKDY